MLVKLDHLPKDRGWNIQKYFSCHHLEKEIVTLATSFNFIFRSRKPSAPSCQSAETRDSARSKLGWTQGTSRNMGTHWVDQLLVLGMGKIQPLIGNPSNGYIKPYYWVDDYPLLFGNNASLDPSTCPAPLPMQHSKQVALTSYRPWLHHKFQNFPAQHDESFGSCTSMKAT